jgi:hypothetical protein
VITGTQDGKQTDALHGSRDDLTPHQSFLGSKNISIYSFQAYRVPHHLPIARRGMEMGITDTMSLKGFDDFDLIILRGLFQFLKAPA